MLKFFAIGMIFFCTIGLAEEKPKDTHELQLPYDVFTKEAIVSIGGTKYRKVEYKDKTYYLQILEPNSSAKELQLYCNQSPAAISSTPGTPLIHMETKVTKRSSFFIEGLRMSCSESAGGGGVRRPNLNADFAIGFTLGDDPKDLIQNKAIYLIPILNHVGFSGTW